MSTYRTPGVSIEELSKLPPSIAEVETAIPAFIGFTRYAGRTGNSIETLTVGTHAVSVEVARISSLLEYENYFGKPEGSDGNMSVTVSILDSMDGQEVKKRSVSTSVYYEPDYSYGALYYHIQLYFANGGGPCYIVSVGDYTNWDISGDAYLAGLQVLEKYDEPTLIVFPDAVLVPPKPADAGIAANYLNAINQYGVARSAMGDVSSGVLYPAQQAYDNDTNTPKTPAVVAALDAARVQYIQALQNLEQTRAAFHVADAAARADQQSGNSYYVIADKALQQCAKLKDRFVIMDCYGDSTTALRLENLGTDVDSLRYGAAYHPFLTTSFGFEFGDYLPVTVDHRRDTNGNGIFNIPVVYGPYNYLNQVHNDEIYNVAKQAALQLKLTLSPSAAVAGVYAKTDSTRGVWKAPANVSLNYVTGVTQRISDAEQESLNDDPYTGKSINAIRTFTGKGTLVWGARTLDANSSNWRYVPVRRLFTMIEESIGKAITQFILEPNDQAIWLKVQGMIGNYLATLWRAGALQGAKEKDAFYVHVGLGKTMTMQDVLDGRMIVEVGLAPVRPAEFIVLKFSHLMAQR